MKQIAELIPIILFFIVYQMDGQTMELAGFSYEFDGIFSATAVLMIAATIQLGISWIHSKGKLEKKAIWLWGAIIVFGGATLMLRNQLFIQWKPTIVYWAFSVALLLGDRLSDRNLLERMMDKELKMEKIAWKKLNIFMILINFVFGVLNLYVAYQFSEDTWVSYKLWSALAFAIVMAVGMVALIYPYIKDQPDSEKNPSDGESSQ